MLQINEKMEAEGASSGVVTVVGSDAPTNYQITPRTEIAGALPAAGSSPAPAVHVGPHPPPVLSLKKKRGRPRKYGPDGSITVALSPKPISMSAPASVIDFSSQKRPKIKPTAAAAAAAPAPAGPKPHQPKVEVDNIGGLLSSSVSANFTPHFITVHAGEDVTMKIMSFSQQGPRAICVLSANGAISSVTLRHPESSGGTLTYEGRFEILSLTGSFMPSESGGFKNRTGGMSVSLAGPDGRVVGGGVAGLLVAAGTVQIVVGSFLAGNQQEPNPKKQKSEYIISGPPSSTVNFSTGGAQEGYGGQRHHASNTTYPSFHGDTRNGSADHDDSYHEG